MCAHTAIVYTRCPFFVCAHENCTDAHTHTHTRLFASVFGSQAWVTARRRLANGGHEWVPPPAKSCQSHGGRFAPFNLRGVVLQMKGDISADRPTTVRQRVTKSGESRVNFCTAFRSRMTCCDLCSRHPWICSLCSSVILKSECLFFQLSSVAKVALPLTRAGPLKCHVSICHNFPLWQTKTWHLKSIIAAAQMFQISPAQIYSLKNTDSAFLYHTTTSTRTKKKPQKTTCFLTRAPQIMVCRRAESVHLRSGSLPASFVASARLLSHFVWVRAQICSRTSLISNKNGRADIQRRRVHSWQAALTGSGSRHDHVNHSPVPLKGHPSNCLLSGSPQHGFTEDWCCDFF